jgi:hypothetical protein
VVHGWQCDIRQDEQQREPEAGGEEGLMSVVMSSLVIAIVRASIVRVI